MATPNYKGANQPSPNGSGWLGSWLGGTPAYSMAKRPSSVATNASAGAAQPQPTIANVVDSMNADNDACGRGPIAIVIPRGVVEQQ